MHNNSTSYLLINNLFTVPMVIDTRNIHEKKSGNKDSCLYASMVDISHAPLSDIRR